MVQDNWLNTFLMAGCIILAVSIILSMIRAIRGPRFTDRIVAVNMIGTMTIIIMCLLSVYFKQDFLVAIVYALLSFIAVVVLARLVIVRRRAQEEREAAESDNEKRKVAK